MLIFGNQTLFDLIYYELALYPNFYPSNQKDETYLGLIFLIGISFLLLFMNFSPLADFNLLRNCSQEAGLRFLFLPLDDIFIGLG